ncbi:hypothetical protein GKZ68_09690 [Hymenobacter sp. BRD128]|uniref:STAS/SEC14 domain-containing protein n=1 Tax=Hymenobacter sp. BRD128 TaxID=2675878 RepID=UPI001567B331|nr:STAS/SEC14 domain-containing protein [Hymenobacter sp. BRD128]QKG56873.1 hypothetical protein GKZ68_09690 [Hymenobacter sp. BRD128]
MPATPDSVILLQNAAGQVSAEPAGYLRLRWGGQPRVFADTCAMFTTAAQALHQRGWSRILVDQTVMQPFTSREQLWISQEWLPKAVQESGYRFGAVIVAANVLTRLATTFVTSTPELPLRYRSFGTEEEALAWLLQQPA